MRETLFLHDESGAIQTDWVILTAAAIGVTLVAMGGVRTVTMGEAEGFEAQVELWKTGRAPTE